MGTPSDMREAIVHEGPIIEIVTSPIPTPVPGPVLPVVQTVSLIV